MTVSFFEFIGYDNGNKVYGGGGVLRDINCFLLEDNSFRTSITEDAEKFTLGVDGFGSVYTDPSSVAMIVTDNDMRQIVPCNGCRILIDNDVIYIDNNRFPRVKQMVVM